MSSESEPVGLQPGEGPIRCPAIRSLIKDGKLTHQDLTTASVQELVRVLSGKNRDLAPDEPGSLANVAGFFAILNHGVPERDGLFQALFRKFRDTSDAAAVATGKSTPRRFDLRLFGSRGDHPGTVDFFKNDAAGQFQSAQFKSVMGKVSDGITLTIQGLAKIIIMANDGDSEGSTLDLAKSSGEWALMVCVLRDHPGTTSISISGLEQMYSHANPTKLLAGSQSATALDWVKVTAQIAAAIAGEKRQSKLVVADALHKAFGGINAESSAKLCPCKTCSPKVWESL